MNIKIECGCGTRFSFDVEPVEGRMPFAVNCPNCNADATEAANQVIAADVPADLPKARLRVAAAPAASEAGPASATPEPTAAFCNRHPSNPAADYCVVCNKPICSDCMTSFGYLCSVNCRYQAEQQGIKVPVYKFQRGREEARNLRKGLILTGGIILFLAGLLVFWCWFDTFGVRPRVSYSVPVSSRSRVQAMFVGPEKMLVISGSRVSMHDIKAKKELWVTRLKPEQSGDTAGNATEDAEEDYDFGVRPKVCADKESLWIYSSGQVYRIDAVSGSIKQTTPIKGGVESCTLTDRGLVVISVTGEDRRLISEIALADGTVSSQEAVVPRSKTRQAVSDELPPNVLPTASLLVERALDEQNKGLPHVTEVSSQFCPAGQNLVELRVRLKELKMTTVETMKKPGPSKLNSQTTASTSAAAVAEEMFNEIKRSRTGGFRYVDESRYEANLRRWVGPDLLDWKEEVTGVPHFFPLKTIDLLVAGKELFVFDKQNRLLFQSKLSYPLDESFTMRSRSSAAPALEIASALYFFDQGVLTAFDLPSGRVLWRLTSFGISHVQTDAAGMLYVNTTSASADDIKYVDQISFTSTSPIILKVDSRTGKIIWKLENCGQQCFLSDKMLFSSSISMGGSGLAGAMAEAVGAPGNDRTYFRVYRVNPSNGKLIWTHYQEGAPDALDFQGTRFLMVYENKVDVMKFFAF